MYSKRSPPTAPAGIEFPNISIPGMCGIAPSTGINRSRRYSSIFGTALGVPNKLNFIRAALCPADLKLLSENDHQRKQRWKVKDRSRKKLPRRRIGLSKDELCSVIQESTAQEQRSDAVSGAR